MTFFVALIILIYIAAMFIRFLTQTSITYTVAREGVMEEGFTVQAVLTREEVCLTASEAGVIQYYYAGGKKLARATQVGVMMNSYYGDLLDQKLKEVYAQLEEIEDTENAAAFDEVQSNIDDTIAQYLRSRTPDDYSSVYELKSEMETYVERRQQLYAISSNQKVLSLLEEKGVYLSEKETEETNLWLSQGGILEYSYDGYEGWTSSQIGSDFIDTYTGQYTYLNTQLQQREKGDVLYRLITSETWNLTAFLTEAQAESLSDRTTVTFRYNDEEEMKGTIVSLTKENETTYKLVLELTSRMQEHDDERIAQLTFIENSISGIKLSNECLTEQSYYRVPKSYLLTSGSSEGVMRRTNSSESFVAVSVVWRDEEWVYFRITEDLQVGDRLLEQGTSETITLGDPCALSGVYVVNGSSEVFTIVDVLYQDQGYSIVDGIDLYDRVKLLTE
jgi:hypothetical protein